MEYKCFPLGSMASNCYLVWCSAGNEALVIDPGYQTDVVFKEIKALGLKVKYIVNTHGHVDHIGGNAQLQAALAAPIAVSAADAPMLTDSALNLSNFVGEPVISPAPALLLQDGDSIDFGACSLTVIATPGHTPGSICLYGQGLLFSGDTLFNGSIGRSDFPRGSSHQIMESIRDRILPLPAATKLLAGHGPESTIGEEKANNPWLQSLQG